MPDNQQFWKQQQEELKQKLGEFERCFEMPLIPGELKQWLAEVRRAFEELRPQFQLQTQHIHAEEFAEITEEDPGLLGRVEEMQEEDQALADLFETIESELNRISRSAEGGTSETDLKDDLKEFVALGLEFVTRLRKQKVTVETWLVEAFTRDRGTVD